MLNKGKNNSHLFFPIITPKMIWNLIQHHSDYLTLMDVFYLWNQLDKKSSFLFICLLEEYFYQRSQNNSNEIYYDAIQSILFHDIPDSQLSDKVILRLEKYVLHSNEMDSSQIINIIARFLIKHFSS